ncbi:MAG: nitrilase-related carbon-nitrogen hydrolase, partial [Myxococcota bacterium]
MPGKKSLPDHDGSPSQGRITVAALQMTSGNDPGKNMDTAAALLKEARGRGATIAGLPECFSFMGSEAEKPSVAEEVDGPSISRMRELARSLGMTILAGTIPELCPQEPEKTANTSVLVGPDGEIAAVYRKIHLFDVELEGAQGFRESSYIVPGREVVTGSAGGLEHGLSVCYDLRFPEHFRSLDLKGAQIFWVPAAFTLATGKDHWE